MSDRCSHCGGNLMPYYDSDTRQTTPKCLQCGRTPRTENAMTETNGATKSTWNPQTKTLEEAEAKPARRMPEMPIGAAANVSGDPLSLYTQAARRLLDADRAHTQAIAAEHKEIEDARTAVEKAAVVLVEARKTHAAARARLDAVLGGIVGKAEPTTPAALPSEKPIGTCKGCGQSRPLNRRGTCAKCWGDRTRKTAVEVSNAAL